MRQTEPIEKPPGLAGIDRYTTLRFQTHRHLVKRDLAFGRDLFAHPTFVRRQFADARIALTFRRKRPGRALQLDHVNHEFDRDIETRCR